MKKPLSIKSFAIASLRRASYRWIPREQARRLAKVARNAYVCASCRKVFTRKETKIDHIHPVVDPIRGFVGFDSFIDRLYCPVEGYQVLCTPCHKVKTQCENTLRKLHKK